MTSGQYIPLWALSCKKSSITQLWAPNLPNRIYWEKMTKATKLGSLHKDNKGIGPLPTALQLLLGLKNMTPSILLVPCPAGQYQAPPICPSRTLARKQVVPGLGVGGCREDSCYFLEATVGHNLDSCLAPHSTRELWALDKVPPLPGVSTIIRPQSGPVPLFSLPWCR